MSGIDEAAQGSGTPLEAALEAGLDTLSLDQEIEFTLYVKMILPLDGYVFWVKASLLSPGALLNAFKFNTTVYNGLFKSAPAEDSVRRVKGSLHYATNSIQDEAETFALNNIIFTAESPIDFFNTIAPNTMWLGEFEGLQFSFSGMRPFYRQADLYHYIGEAVYPDMQSIIVQDVANLNNRSVVVSNSLPIWLSMNGYKAEPWEAFGNDFILYPSFLAPDNIRPPWAAVHIPPESTTALALAPTFSEKLTHRQLTRETVKITIWGSRNYNAQDFVDFVSQYSLNTELFGLMNSPILRDEKRVQNEISAIAMKKTVEFDINYYQDRVRDIARQLILSSVPTYIVEANVHLI